MADNKKGMENYIEIIGKLYQKELEIKKDRNDKTYIKGTVSILVDENTQQVETVEVFIYEKTKSNTENKTFALLKKINGEENNCYANNDKTKTRLSAVCNFTRNIYFSSEGDDLTMVETFPKHKLLFLNEERYADNRAVFKIDGELKNIVDIEDDKGTTGEIKITLSVYDNYTGTRDYTFKVADLNHVQALRKIYVPGETYLRISGEIVNNVVKKEEEDTGASIFGVSTVKKEFTIRDYLVKSADYAPLSLFTEEVIKASAAKREEVIAKEKNRAIEYKKNGPTTTATSGTTATALKATGIAGFEF